MSKLQLLAIMVLCLMCNLGFADGNKVGHQKLVRAEAFELVDHNGKVRGGLKVGSDIGDGLVYAIPNIPKHGVGQAGLLVVAVWNFCSVP